jgi:hypothetical protein
LSSAARGVRAADPVYLTVPCPAAWRGLLAVVPALAAASFTAWLLGHLGLSQAWALWALWVVPLLWRLSRGAPVELAWDGQTWRVNGEPVTLQLAIDGGEFLLLRTRQAAARWTWLPVARSSAGMHWHPLRCAVHGRRPGQAPDLFSGRAL